MTWNRRVGAATVKSQCSIANWIELIVSLCWSTMKSRIEDRKHFRLQTQTLTGRVIKNHFNDVQFNSYSSILGILTTNHHYWYSMVCWIEAFGVPKRMKKKAHRGWMKKKESHQFNWIPLKVNARFIFHTRSMENIHNETEFWADTWNNLFVCFFGLYSPLMGEVCVCVCLCETGIQNHKRQHTIQML